LHVTHELVFNHVYIEYGRYGLDCPHHPRCGFTYAGEYEKVSMRATDRLWVERQKPKPLITTKQTDYIVRGKDITAYLSFGR